LPVIASCVFAACGVPSTDVADISIVTDLPKEVGPGGFQEILEEGGVSAGYFFKAEISDCGPVVVDSARAWAGRSPFSESERDVAPRTANLRLTSTESDGGTVVIRYFLASARPSARVRITYEAGAYGTARTPAELLAMGVGELVQAELAAAQCEIGS
jgi:hypothetical protein